MKRFWFVISLAVSLLPAWAYAQPEKLQIVATNSIIADWVSNVAGDQVNLAALVGPDRDVHTFEPTPSENILLSKANLVFENGLGLEHWMDKLYSASHSNAKRITLTRGVVKEPLTILRLGRQHQDDVDPHAWHNVRYVVGMVKKISQALETADPTHAKIYESNAQAYVKQLQELDYWVMATTSKIPKAKRKLVTNHDSLGYFCERYQFTLVGAAFESATTEAEDPSAKEMAELISKIRRTGVPAVFAENITSPKIINSLAQEAKVQLAPALYTDALGVRGSAADTYIKMIQYNVKTIVDALNV